MNALFRGSGGGGSLGRKCSLARLADLGFLFFCGPFAEMRLPHSFSGFVGEFKALVPRWNTRSRWQMIRPSFGGCAHSLTRFLARRNSDVGICDSLSVCLGKLDGSPCRLARIERWIKSIYPVLFSRPKRVGILNRLNYLKLEVLMAIATRPQLLHFSAWMDSSCEFRSMHLPPRGGRHGATDIEFAGSNVLDGINNSFHFTILPQKLVFFAFQNYRFPFGFGDRFLSENQDGQ